MYEPRPLILKTCEWLINGSEPCGKLCEGKNALCATHAREARKIVTDAEKEAVKLDKALQKAKIKGSQPRPKPKQVSDKRKELNKEYFTLVDQFKRDNPFCKANVNEYCTKTTDDPHHRKGRGEFLLSVDFWLPVCRSCHDYIEAHPLEAKEKGWSESRLSKHEPHKI